MTSTHTVDLTTEIEIDGFHICDLDVEAEFTYKKGRPDSYDEPGYGPEIEFVGVKLVGVGGGPRKKTRNFPAPPAWETLILERLQSDEDAKNRAVLEVENGL